MTILTYFLICVILLLSFISFNLYRKNEVLENELNNTDLIDEASKYYEFILRLLIKTQNELNLVDKRGSFSSDDEVGFAFRVIKNSIDDCVSKLQKINGEEEETEKG